MNYHDLSKKELESLHASLSERFERVKSERLSLDLTRGKPAADQLDLSNDLDGILKGFYLLQDGTDVRNYGGILGIPEAREFGAELLGSTSDEVMVGGNSSLTLMYLFLRMMTELWQSAEDQPRFLCPVPGYDRHFAICEEFGIDMVTVPMTDTGPDMDVVERLVREDASIKGIWCVPRYSNPNGCTYSDEVVDRMSRLPQHAGDDFVIMWDNAYIAHHLAETPDPLKSIMACCREMDTTKNLVILASTSKITFAGAGISFLATAREQLAQFEKYLGIAMIGFDKVNQLRHLRFLEDQAGLAAHMEKHRKILAPKFKSVLSILETELGGTGIARWTKPNGGYFVSLDTMPGLASNVIGMAADAGVKLTPAGATFPYGRDPENSNIRIAPTYPPVEQLNKAMSVLVLCIQLCSAAQLIRV